MSDPVRIVLVEIVKNESANMKANLLSVKGLVDAVSILDTGSTDNTMELIQTIVKEELRVPLHLPQEPFVNFGVSRTHSQEKAVEFVGKLGWPLESTQALFLDADAELIENFVKDKEMNQQPRVKDKTLAEFKKLIESKRPKSMFQDHVLSFTTQSRLGLARMDGAWTCKNACHEFWEGPQETPTYLAPWKVLEKPTGGNKPSKLQRELDLLAADLAAGNRTPRNLFYQGRALDSVGRADEAIQILEECIRVTSWPEERYESRLIVAKLWALRDAEDQKRLQEFQTKQEEALKSSKVLVMEDEPKPLWPGAHEKSMRIYWQAHEDAPARAEALFQVAFQHRIRKEYRNACEVLRIALESVELPKDETDVCDALSALRDRPNAEWTSLITSLFSLSGSWIVLASKRRTSLFQNKDILHDKLLEELSISAFQMNDPEWKLRGHRACEYLIRHGRTAITREHATKTLQFYMTPVDELLKKDKKEVTK